MKHSYTVFWEEVNPAGEKDPGWYCQVSKFIPWGPFETQAEALESMMMEWPIFESIQPSGCDTACNPKDCNSCTTGCCL